MKSLIRLVLLLILAFAGSARARTIHVSEFGATPDDGRCDMKAIAAAIAAATREKGAEVRFAAGTYNLTTPATPQYYLGLINTQNITLRGEVDASGRPATRLERNVTLNNDTSVPLQILVQGSRTITIGNFILANNPPCGSTGRVIAVNKDRDEVVVEVLPGLPAYDGMRCASAHAWDLATGRLKRFGSTPESATLTIGVGTGDHLPLWQAVPGTGARQLRMKGAGFAAKVSVGDGISWHHRVRNKNQMDVRDSDGVVYENIILPNVTNMGLRGDQNRNLVFRRVRFEPEGGNLAVGGRDGLHLINTSGTLVVEDCYFKGLRMDPLVIKRLFGRVQEVRADGALLVAPAYAIPTGDRLRFWVGPEPVDRTVQRCEQVEEGVYAYWFRDDAPAGTGVGSVMSYLTHSLDRGVVRNSVFVDNFGSAIVNFEENITVEGCTFDNNAYQVKYGPNHVSGGFVRNNVVRNNRFLDVGWVDIARRGQPSCLVIHSLSTLFKEPRYNRDILIEGNLFRNPHREQDAVAVDIRHSEAVTLRDNVFQGFSTEVKRDGKPARP